MKNSSKIYKHWDFKISLSLDLKLSNGKFFIISGKALKSVKPGYLKLFWVVLNVNLGFTI